MGALTICTLGWFIELMPSAHVGRQCTKWLVLRAILCCVRWDYWRIFV